jgi:hypothetical protein
MGLLIAGSRVPAAMGPDAAPTDRAAVVGGVRSWGGGGGPAEAGELSGDRDRGDVVGLAALAEAVVEAVQSVLGAPGDLQDVVRRVLLARAQGDADPGLAGVVPRGLDQQPPRVDDPVLVIAPWRALSPD